MHTAADFGLYQQGHDRIFGGDDPDSVQGNRADDNRVDGEQGADLGQGGDGNDGVYGGDGNYDDLLGQEASDVLNGGAGFADDCWSAPPEGDGNDEVNCEDPTAGD